MVKASRLKKQLTSFVLVLFLLVGVAQAGLLEDFFAGVQRSSGVQAIYGATTTEAACAALNCQPASGYTAGTGYACVAGTGTSYNVQCSLAVAGTYTGKCNCVQTACLSSPPSSCGGTTTPPPTTTCVPSGSNSAGTCCSGTTRCSDNVCRSSCGTSSSTLAAGTFQVINVIPTPVQVGGGSTGAEIINLGTAFQVQATFTATYTGYYIIGAKANKVSDSLLYSISPTTPFLQATSNYCNANDKSEATNRVYLNAGESTTVYASPMPSTQGSYDLFLVAYANCGSTAIRQTWLGVVKAKSPTSTNQQCVNGQYRCSPDANSGIIQVCTQDVWTTASACTSGTHCSAPVGSALTCVANIQQPVCGRTNQACCATGSACVDTGTSCQNNVCKTQIVTPTDSQIVCAAYGGASFDPTPGTYSCVNGVKPGPGLCVTFWNCDDCSATGKKYVSGPTTSAVCTDEVTRLNDNTPTPCGTAGQPACENPPPTCASGQSLCGDNTCKADCTNNGGTINLAKYAFCADLESDPVDYYCRPDNKCSSLDLAKAAETSKNFANQLIFWGIPVISLPDEAKLYQKDGYRLRSGINASACTSLKDTYGVCDDGSTPGFKEGEVFVTKNDNVVFGAFGYSTGNKVASNSCCGELSSKLVSDSSTGSLWSQTNTKAYLCEVSGTTKFLNQLKNIYETNPIVIYIGAGLVVFLLFGLVKGASK